MQGRSIAVVDHEQEEPGDSDEDFDFDAFISIHDSEDIDDDSLSFDFDAFISVSDSEEVSEETAGNVEVAELSDLSSDIDSDTESDESESEDGPNNPLLIAAAPQVLEPYCHISRISGISYSLPKGYRICGDNIDKTVRPRYMRSDKANKSLHYFHSYAVQNRVDVSHLADSPVDMSTFTPDRIASTILPSSNDDEMLRENVAVLISRVLTTHLKFFQFSFDEAVDWHISHQFSHEMSQKSTLVSSLITTGLSYVI